MATSYDGLMEPPCLEAVYLLSVVDVQVAEGSFGLPAPLMGLVGGI